MKTSFSSCYKWAGRALMLGVLLLSGLFTACFDDTDILARLDNLEKRVSELEKDYEAQAKTLQTLSNLSTVVNNLKTAVETNTADISKNVSEIEKLLKDLGDLTGKVNLSEEQITKILTTLQSDIKNLQDKDKALQTALDALGLTISKYEYDAATGIATVTLSDGAKLTVVTKDNAVDAVKAMKGEDGNYYWAVGGEFLKDGNGNNIPIAVTPQFKIDADTREVSVSVDGGKTWINTGIVDEEVAPALFKDVTSDSKNVYFTLPDGTVLTVALSKEACDVTLELNKLYVDYGKTETVEIEMANVEKYIIVKPEGWRVSVKDNVLSITAPEKGVGEAEGLVQLFTVAEDGHAAIFEVKVIAGLPNLALTLGERATFDITLDSEDAKYIYGVAVLDEETTLETIYAANTAEIKAENVKSGSLKGLSIAEALGLEALDAAKEYVVWAVVLDGDETAYKAKSFENMVSLKYVLKPEAKFTFTDVTAVDANMKIETFGLTGNLLYYIQPLGGNAADWTPEETKEKIDAQIKSATSTSNVLTLTEGNFEDSLLELYRTYMGSATKNFTPGHSIFVAVVPEKNKTGEAVMYDIVTLEGYKYDPESTAEVTFGTPTENYTTVSVRITPKTGTYFRFNYMTEKEFVEEYAEGDDVEALMKFAIGTASASGEKKTAQTASPYPVTLGESYVVVVYAYDPATAIGKIFTKKLTCPALNYNADAKLSLDVKYTGVNYAEVEIKADVELSSIRYAFMRKADWEKNSTLKGDLAITEEKMATNLTVSNRRNFNTANLKPDNLYKLENLYLNEPDQCLFVIAFDKDNKIVHMANTVLDTKKPFEEGFDASLVKPTVKDVLYIASGTGYKQTIDKWTRMSTVTDVTTLDNLTGMYWLDLDWGTTEVKRMWLSSENAQNWKAPNYPLTGTDMKADALSVLKKRAGYTASGASPDFYGLNATTGALALTGVEMMNTSENKTLRDKSDAANIKAKTIHFVWETKDGKYGYMTVVPEDFAKKSEGGDEPGTEGPGDKPSQDFTNTPWGHMWLYQVPEVITEMGMPANTFFLLDLGATEPGMIYFAVGEIADNNVGAFTRMSNYDVDVKTLKVDKVNGVITWENNSGLEYKIMWADLELDGNKGTVTMASEEDDTYYAINEMFGMQMFGTPERMGVTVSFVGVGGDEGL